MFLFGTIHLGVPINDVPMVVMDKFYQSDRFDMEIDAKNYDTERHFTKNLERTYTESKAILNSLHKNNPEAAERLGKYLKLDYLKNPQPLEAPEKKLSQRLTPKAWAYTRAYFKQMDLETLEKISPDTVAKFITTFQKSTIEAPTAWFRRMDPKNSMDLAFHSLAFKHGKQVYQLDDAEVLAPACADIVASTQIEGSFDKVDAGEVVQGFAKLEQAYRSGNEEEVLKETSKGGKDLLLCTLDDRNRKWLPRLIADAEGAAMRGQSPLFVAVGTAHLFGPAGLIELLKKEGYSVERVGN